MSRTCRKCGAPVPAGASFFCHKCGAQLPAEEPDLPVCRRCGKKQADLQSRFCDRCGSPLSWVVQPLPPVTPIRQSKTCPRCGFENFGTGHSYCKKCGTALENIEPTGMVQEQRIQERQAGIGEDRKDSPPLITATRSRGVPSVAPEQPRAVRPGHARSYRKAAMGVALIILILVVIIGAFIFMNPAGDSAAASNNSAATGFLGSLSKILPEKTVAATGIAPQSTQERMTIVGNQGTAVFSDTPPA